VRAPATLRALPVMLRVGFAEAVAYRAELVVWVLSTTMPLIMLALWSAVARDAPVGRFGQSEFTAYFLVTFIVRQLVGSWASWQLNWEIRHGTLALRLLRPVHPMLAFAVENVGVLPLRVLVCVPVAVIALAAVGAAPLPGDATGWAFAAAALAGGWLITFLSSFAIGTLAFYFESSLKVMDVWLALFFVLSGYVAPVELYPPLLRGLADWLPFRYQIGLPVELLTSAHELPAALRLLAWQWAWVAALAVAALALWRGGLRRFAAYGG
jgi:ABC-2 type transport system permease protein